MAFTSTAATLKKLNLGCGDCFHPDWCNLDLQPLSPAVRRHDIRHRLPFGPNEFDAVYHSHVLEHLSSSGGEKLMRECFRVLKPGGILRVVVPDLESIARLYLDRLQRVDVVRADTMADYRWMKLELIDQMVRDHSGGQMGEYMADPEIANSEFVRSRIGNEFWRCRNSAECPPGGGIRVKTLPPRQPRKNSWNRWRHAMAVRAARWFLGPVGETALVAGLFREQGEVHRWMYDRVSLRDLALQTGFVEFGVCSAFTSQIPNFDSFELDAVGGEIRKPDSLFGECRKPVQPAE